MKRIHVSDMKTEKWCNLSTNMLAIGEKMKGRLTDNKVNNDVKMIVDNLQIIADVQLANRYTNIWQNEEEEIR